MLFFCFVLFFYLAFERLLVCYLLNTSWTQDVHCTYVRCSGNVQDTSYACSIYVLCPGGHCTVKITQIFKGLPLDFFCHIRALVINNEGILLFEKKTVFCTQDIQIFVILISPQIQMSRQSQTLLLIRNHSFDCFFTILSSIKMKFNQKFE